MVKPAVRSPSHTWYMLSWLPRVVVELGLCAAVENRMNVYSLRFFCSEKATVQKCRLITRNVVSKAQAGSWGV